MNLLKSKRKLSINSPFYLSALTSSAPPLLAHTNHPHNSNNTDSKEAAKSESTTMPEMVSEQEPPTATVEIAPSPEPVTTTDTTVAVTKSSTLSNPLLGLGEMILALIVTAPFLLLAIKRQIQK